MKQWIKREEYDKLAVAIRQEPPVSIRLNDGKLKIENGKCRIVPQAGCITDFQLSAFNFEFNQVPWSSEKLPGKSLRLSSYEGKNDRQE